MNCFQCSNSDPAGVPRLSLAEGSRTTGGVMQFTSRQIEAMMKHRFSTRTVLGQGGFGYVHKGHFNGQAVAIKELDHRSLQGAPEFLAEINTLTQLRHPNLIRLVGFCEEGEKRVIVYEYVRLRSLEDQLHGDEENLLFKFLKYVGLFRRRPLDWKKRMKIMVGVARGLQYLHERNPPIVYRDLKASNVLVGDDYQAKLSDFGLARVGPPTIDTYVSTRVMGTEGYCAPEYARTGHLTLITDIYSFGVVLLEVITGREAINQHAAQEDMILVDWAPLKEANRDIPRIADPKLEGRYPMSGISMALDVALACVSVDPGARPILGHVVNAMDRLEAQASNPCAWNDPIN